MKQEPIFDAIILGAGGAGLMCAATAGKRGKRVLVLDHADEPGKKILISGGGRCNFTNLDVKPERFLSSNPHFAKSALARYTQNDFIDLVNAHGIAWHEKAPGQLFCDGSAKQIVKMLLDECPCENVTFKYSETINNIVKSESIFEVATRNSIYKSKSLIIATGGPSIPKMGASGFAYDLARQFKLKVVEPRPALVPFTLGKDQALFTELSGIAAETVVSNSKASFREATLFTHKGLSGPAILQLSSYWRNGEIISVNFLPDEDTSWLKRMKQQSPKLGLKAALAKHLPERLAETLARKLDRIGKNLADFKDADLEAITSRLASWKFTPSGSEGFAKAEVTIGGVATNELSSKTFEAKKVPGLYFIGEAVDVTGWLGGYNFQWAWSSGWVVGGSI